jgi:hypothetical protein
MLVDIRHSGDLDVIGSPVVKADKIRACCITGLSGSDSQPLIIQPGTLTELLIPRPTSLEPIIGLNL